MISGSIFGATIDHLRTKKCSESELATFEKHWFYVSKTQVFEVQRTSEQTEIEKQTTKDNRVCVLISFWSHFL